MVVESKGGKDGTDNGHESDNNAGQLLLWKTKQVKKMIRRKKSAFVYG